MLTQEELLRFIQAPGENFNIDAKGPTEWDGGVESAKLAKDIVAFANSRGGGVIIIGKSQNSDGTFRLVGLSLVQMASFDTTKIADWINSKFEPPVSLVSYPVETEQGRFVVLEVDEFGDIPSLCVKSYAHPQTKELLLKEKTIYVRTANAARLHWEPLNNCGN